VPGIHGCCLDCCFPAYTFPPLLFHEQLVSEVDTHNLTHFSQFSIIWLNRQFIHWGNHFCLSTETSLVKSPQNEIFKGWDKTNGVMRPLIYWSLYLKEVYPGENSVNSLTQWIWHFFGNSLWRNIAFICYPRIYFNNKKFNSLFYTCIV
jgi:hypothetical protein